MSRLTVVGATCGVGSMLIGARQAGFEVLGNIEWRKYYFARDEQGRNTFTENFPNAVFKEKFDDLTLPEIERLMNPTLAMGHPECGHFSKLNMVNPSRDVNLMDAGDIPLFCDLIAQIKPRFFVMDDLPLSFGAFPMEEYVKKLPDYDLFPEWISNFHYGNIQKNRKRMFMLGALKQEKWVFLPGEEEHSHTMRTVLEDLGEPRAGSNFPNHDPHSLTDLAGKGRHLDTMGRDSHPTYAELQAWFKANPEGTILRYITEDGTVKVRPSHATGYWNGHSHVLDGGSLAMHPVRCTPFTIRERARIQGAPDEFVFYGTKLTADGEYNHEKNIVMVKQSGKFMPVQFCRYVSRQIAAFVEGEPFECSQQRLIAPNEHVDQAKQWFCANVGYADQTRACGACWLAAHCAIRTERYGIGAPPAGALPAPRVSSSPRVRSKPPIVSPKRVYAPVKEKDVSY